MFVPKYLFDKFMAMQEQTFMSGQRITEVGLQRVMAAKDSEVASVIAAKNEEVEALRLTVKELRAQIDHERQRAEAAIDILLTKNGEAGPIRNADLMREQAEREAKQGPANMPDSPAAKMRQFMSAIAGVGEDIDDGPTLKPDEKMMVGGIS